MNDMNDTSPFYHSSTNQGLCRPNMGTETSIATGFGGGAFSLVEGIKANASFVSTLLERTATDLSTTNPQGTTGHGLINISLALQTLTDTAPPTMSIVHSSTGTIFVFADNIGLHQVSTPTQTFTFQGQNRSLALPIPSSVSSANYSAQDLAGHTTFFTYTKSSKQASGFESVSVVGALALLLALQLYKKKKGIIF